MSSADTPDRRELVALRKLARAALHIFEAEGLSHRPMSQLDVLSEALRCAQSDFAVLGDSACGSSGMADSMVFRRAELRIDLALALADYCEAFGAITPIAVEAAE